MSVQAVRHLLQRLLTDEAFRDDFLADQKSAGGYNLTSTEQEGLPYLRLLVAAGEEIIQNTLPQILADLSTGVDFRKLVQDHAARHDLTSPDIGEADANGWIIAMGDITKGGDIEIVIGDMRSSMEETEEAGDDWGIDDYDDFVAGLPGEPPPIGPDD